MASNRTLPSNSSSFLSLADFAPEHESSFAEFSERRPPRFRGRGGERYRDADLRCPEKF